MNDARVPAVTRPPAPLRRGRPDFGPPRASPGAFAWSALQVPRALWWLLREPELRAFALRPALVTLAVAAFLAVGALLGAGFLQAFLFEHRAGPLGNVAWFAERVVLIVLLLLASAIGAWQLQGAISAAYMERIALFVQRAIEGEAPVPAIGALEVLKKAVFGLVPHLRDLLAWALSALVAASLVFVPIVGPVLVVVAQTLLAAGFLAHAAITENRDRLGLPRWLLFREPAAVLGLAAGLVPLVMLPPLLLVLRAPVAVAGSLVALGIRRRNARA